jgi:hypothetical protein
LRLSFFAFGLVLDAGVAASAAQLNRGLIRFTSASYYPGDAGPQTAAGTLGSPGRRGRGLSCGRRRHSGTGAAAAIEKKPPRPGAALPVAPQGTFPVLRRILHAVRRCWTAQFFHRRLTG